MRCALWTDTTAPFAWQTPSPLSTSCTTAGVAGSQGGGVLPPCHLLPFTGITVVRDLRAPPGRLPGRVPPGLPPRSAPRPGTARARKLRYLMPGLARSARAISGEPLRPKNDPASYRAPWPSRPSPGPLRPPLPKTPCRASLPRSQSEFPKFFFRSLQGPDPRDRAAVPGPAHVRAPAHVVEASRNTPKTGRKSDFLVARIRKACPGSKDRIAPI